MKILKKINLLLMVLIFPIIIFTACSTDTIFTVSFMVDDNAYGVIKTSGNETILIPQVNPEKEHFQFDGWYWDDSVWEREFSHNSLLDFKMSENISVYSKWSAIDYNITYHLDGGEAEENPSSYNLEKGLNLNEPVKLGHVFSGWYLDSDYSVLFNESIGGDLSLYAKFEWDEETILLDFTYSKPTPSEMGIGDSIDLPTVFAVNVFNNESVASKVTITVLDSSNDESEISNYLFTPQQIGEHIITYRVEGQEEDVETVEKSFTIMVKDKTAPTLRPTNPYELNEAGDKIVKVFSFEDGSVLYEYNKNNNAIDEQQLLENALNDLSSAVPSVVVKGEEVRFPAAYAQDNVSKIGDLTYTLSVRRGRDSQVTRITGDINEIGKYTFGEAGDYSVRYIIRDEAGNESIESYNLVVRDFGVLSISNIEINEHTLSDELHIIGLYPSAPLPFNVGGNIKQTNTPYILRSRLVIDWVGEDSESSGNNYEQIKQDYLNFLKYDELASKTQNENYVWSKVNNAVSDDWYYLSTDSYNYVIGEDINTQHDILNGLNLNFIKGVRYVPAAWTNEHASMQFEIRFEIQICQSEVYDASSTKMPTETIEDLSNIFNYIFN